MRWMATVAVTSLFVAACAAGAGGNPVEELGNGATTGASANTEGGSDDASDDSSQSGSDSGSQSGGSQSGSSKSGSTSSGSKSSGSKSGSSSGSSTKDASVSSSGTSSGSTTVGSGMAPSSTYLPKISGTCPTIAAGMNGTQLTFAGEPVAIWSGQKGSGGGPLVMFWFETGGQANDVTFQFGTAQIQAVTAAGGIVASFAKSNGMGTNTGDLVWYTGDFDTADQVVACAIDQFKIDTRQIFTTGASAGALQAAWMAYARSGYIAAAAPISGGIIFPQAMQDPSNVPAAMAIHGAPGLDVVAIDFASASANWEADWAKKGGFSMDCNTGGGHVGGPPQICPAIWQFFKDHPFQVSKQPYPPIPSVFPSYCQIGPRLADGGAP